MIVLQRPITISSYHTRRLIKQKSTHHDRMPHWLSACIGALVCLIATGCQSTTTPPKETTSWQKLTHQDLSYTLYLDQHLQVEQELTQKAGWAFVEPGDAMAGAVWLTTITASQLTQPNALSKATLQSSLTQIMQTLQSVRGDFANLTTNAVNLNIVNFLSGQGLQKQTSLTLWLKLTTPSLNAPNVLTVFAWLSKHTGQTIVIDRTPPNATEFDIVISLTPLLDRLGKQIWRTSEEALVALSIYAVAQNQLPNQDHFAQDALAYAQSLPLATTLATYEKKALILQQSLETKTIALLAVLDQQKIVASELEYIANELAFAIQQAQQPQVNISFAALTSCQASVLPAGNQLFINILPTQTQPEIKIQLHTYLQTLVNQSTCNGFEFIRSAILAAQTADAWWQEADQKWLLWFAKTADQSSSLTDPTEAPAPGELLNALQTLNTHYALIGPIDETCETADQTALPDDSVITFLSKINPLQPLVQEYCQQWSLALKQAWRLQASLLSQLQLIDVPLPGTLKTSLVTNTNQVVILELNSEQGYFFDLPTLAIVPGSDVTWQADTRISVEYETLLEPNTTPLQ